ncbi:hypothetical protein M0812_21121 [Anaeramoeba flamelloides]|uniref:Uncharacterized protein n=1 Tax=Anaeramoeba flamelloides TaxID=1746091 RepID=A0AAV7YWA0_9EUKA|nr:hypothetical protein M0812_21121 [Anaeramoeba flamelloides]
MTNIVDYSSDDGIELNELHNIEKTDNVVNTQTNTPNQSTHSMQQKRMNSSSNEESSSSSSSSSLKVSSESGKEVDSDKESEIVVTSDQLSGSGSDEHTGTSRDGEEEEPRKKQTLRPTTASRLSRKSTKNKNRERPKSAFEKLKTKKAIAIIVFCCCLVAGLIYMSVDLYVRNALENADIEMTDVEIKSMDSQRMQVNTEFKVEIDSPVLVGFSMADSKIGYNDKNVGKVTFSKKSFSTISEKYNSDLVVDISELDNYLEMIQDFIELSQITIPFEVTIKFQGKMSLWKDRELSKKLRIAACGKVWLDLGEYELLEFGHELISLKCVATTEINTIVNANIPPLLLEMYYKDQLISSTLQEDVHFEKGANAIDAFADLLPEDTTLIEDFINSKYLKFHTNIFVYIEGADKSRLPVLFNKTINIDGFDNFPFRLEGLEIVEVNDDNIDLIMKLQFNNTSPISAVFHKMEIEILYQDVVIDNALINDQQLVPGPNYISVDVSLDESKSDLLQDFVMNEEVSIYLRCNLTVNKGGDEIEILNRPVEIEGLSGIEFEFTQNPHVVLEENSLKSSIDVDLEYTSNLDAEFGRWDVDIIYEGIIIGTASQTDVIFKKGPIHFELDLDLDSTEVDIVRDFLDLDEVTVILNGTIFSHANSPKEDGISLFTRNFTMQAFGGFDFTVETMSLTEFTKTEMTVITTINFHNPSDVTAVMTEMNFDLEYKGVNISTPVFGDIQIDSGDNRLDFEFVLDTSTTDIFEDFIRDEQAHFNLYAQFRPKDYLIDIEVILDGFNGLEFDISQIRITMIEDPDLTLEIDTDIDNPTTLDTEFDKIWIQLFYEDTYVGDATQSNAVLIKQQQNAFTFVADCTENGTALIDDFFKKENITFLMKAFARVDVDDPTQNDIAVFERLITIVSFNGMPFELVEFSPLSMTDSEIVVKIDSDLENPTKITNEFDELRIDIEYQDKLIGNILLTEFFLKRGLNDIIQEVTLSENGTNLVDDFIKSENLTLQLYGNVRTGSTKWIEIFQKNYTVTGMDNLPFSITKTEFVNANGDLLDFDLDIEFNNPSTVNADCSEIVCKIYYKGDFVGETILYDKSLDMGYNTFNFLPQLNSEGTDLIDTFIQNTTVDLDLNLFIKFDQGDLINLFNKTIQIKGFNNLQTDVKEFDLISSGTDYIEVTIEVTLTNPSDIDVRISNFYFDLFFDSKKIGYGQKQDFSLPVGTLQLFIDSRIEGDEAAISDFLGRYISGKTSQLELDSDMTILFENSGTTWDFSTIITTNLDGIESQIVDLTVSGFTTTPSLGTNVDVEIFNPMKFTIDFVSFLGPSYYNNTLTNPSTDKIYLYDVDIDNSASPVPIAPDGSHTEQENYPITDISQTATLSLLLLNGNLYIDVWDGQLVLDIGDFRCNLNIDLIGIKAHA